MPTTQSLPIEPNHRGRLRFTMNDKIDVCRGLFAFLVVAAHAVDIAWAIHPEGPSQYPWWLHRFLLYVVAAGVYWVIGFFVISGYCIQLSVSRAIERGSFPLSNYLTGRLSRILPLYYLALLWAMTVEWLIAGARPHCWSNGINGNALIAQVFVLQNLTQTYGSYAPSWSITNEMFYYLFYGFLVCIAVKRGIRATTLGMIACVTIALPMNLLYFTWNRSPFVCAVGLLFGLGTFWFSGALVAEYQESLRRSRAVRVGSRFWPLILATAIVMWFSQHVHLQLVYVMLAMAFTMMLVQIVTADEKSALTDERSRTSPLPQLLGLASYPTYLFHGPLLMLVASLIMRSKLINDWRLTWFILVFVGISSGTALGYLIERPIMAWRASWLKSLKLARSATSANDRVDRPIWGIHQ
jgi:peptidoglycan/LPS O-acetylase OafA/YrhL